MNEYVKLSIEDHIGYIEFFHPQSNALPANILEKLTIIIKEAGENKDVNVIVLKSGGSRAFCAGASFDELSRISNKKEGKTFFSGFANVINACRKCPKLIIGRIQGKAVGGGVGMAAATDYCFATKYASIKLSELAVGIGPFVVGPAVERKIGNACFSAMTINATKWFDAEWAREKGLYTEIFDSTEQMDEEIDELVKKLSNSNIEAMKELKTVFWKGTEDWDTLLIKRAEVSGKLVLSDFTKNAIASFKNK